MMAKFDGLTILGAVVAGGPVVLSAVFVPGIVDVTLDFDRTVPLAILLIWTLGAIPLAFFMPLMRAGFFGRAWKVPATAYVIPRWTVQLLAGMSVGSAAGYLALAVVRDQRFYGLALSAALLAAAFVAGAWRRLGRPEKADFEMRCLP